MGPKFIKKKMGTRAQRKGEELSNIFAAVRTAVAKKDRAHSPLWVIKPFQKKKKKKKDSKSNYLSTRLGELGKEKQIKTKVK